MARLLWYLDPSSPHQLRKKNVIRVGPPLIKLSGSAHHYKGSDQVGWTSRLIRVFVARIGCVTLTQLIHVDYLQQEM